MKSLVIPELRAHAPFDELEPEALATASIGQTHRGKTKEGKIVAVKVQRPGIEATSRKGASRHAASAKPWALSPPWLS